MSDHDLLIVDDEVTLRQHLVSLLGDEGYTVLAAENGQEALEMLRSHSIALMLADINLDWVDGLDLLTQARHNYPDLALIVLTGHATVNGVIRALRHGVSDFLLKPAQSDMIVQAVTVALQRRQQQQRRAHLERIAAQMVGVLDVEVPAPLMTPPEPSSTQQYGCLRLDTAAYRATLAEEPLDLTPTEFRLLSKLTSDPGKTFNYVELVEAACGYTCTRQEAREIIGTHTRNLRQKLGIDVGEALFVESVRGVGYRIIPPIEHAAV